MGTYKVQIDEPVYGRDEDGNYELRGGARVTTETVRAASLQEVIDLARGRMDGLPGAPPNWVTAPACITAWVARVDAAGLIVGKVTHLRREILRPNGIGGYCRTDGRAAVV